MVGNCANRNMNSVYQSARTADLDAGEGALDERRSSRFSSRRRQQSPPATSREEVLEEHMTAADLSSSEDEEGEGAHEEGACSASSSLSSVYLRGPASLPQVPLPHRSPLIRPEGNK
jgi:hypothetical protein